MRHYVFDSKFDGDFDNWPGRVGGDTAPRKPGRNDRYQVWQPVQLLPEEIEKWLWGILHDAPAVLEVDELLHVSYKGGTQFNAILKTGRSLPVGVISLTQEMSQIPGNSYKQSDHRLGFYVDQAGRYDTQIRNSLLKAKMGDPKDPYGFWYQHKNGRGEPPYYPTVQKFLGV